MSMGIDLARHPRSGGAGPDGIPVPPEVLQARLATLRASAEAVGLAALVIFSHASRVMSGTATHGNLRFLLDWTAGTSPATLIVPVDGAPVIVVPGPSDVGDMRERCPWIADLRCEPSRNHGRLARLALEQRGIRGRIGLLGAGELTHVVYSELTAPSPPTSKNAWTFEAADVLLDEQRMVKDEIG